MLMADDNSDYWTYGEFSGVDDSDKFSIDLESLFAILSEESDPSAKQHSQSSPEDLSLKNSFQGESAAGEVNNERDSQPQNGIQNLEESHQSDPVQPGSSVWYPSEYSEPSYSEAEMGSECLFGSPGNFGMTFDHGKFEIPHMDSPGHSCSASLTDWLGISHSEHDTCSGERVGGSIPAPCYSNIDSRRIPNHMSNSSSTFKFTSGDTNHAPGYSNYMNLLHLKSESENDFGHGGDLNFKYPSHFTMMDNSVSNYENLNGISGSSMEGLGSVERNPCTTPLQFPFMDAHLSLTNPPHADIDDCQVSDIKSEIDNNCSPAHYCGHSSAVADNGPFVDPSRQHLPDTKDFPFMTIKRENMMYMSDAVEGQLLTPQKIRANGKMDLGAEEVITGTSVHGVSMIDCSDMNNYQGTSFKCESVSCSPIRRHPSCDAADASRQSFDGIQFVSSEKLAVSMRDERENELHESGTRKYVIDGDDMDCFSPVCISSSEIQTIRIKDEKDQKVLPLGRVSSHSGRAAVEVVRSTISSYSAHIDDDPDICILEDISDPRLPPPAVVHGRSLVTAHRSGFSDPLHSGMGAGTRLKTNDERLTFRVALQDLSQPKSESSPPDGVLAVPLLRHQRIALSWMVQKETASLHCSGGILADDQGLGKTISTIALILKERSPSSKMSSMAMKEDESEALNLDDDDDGVLHLDGMKQDGDSGRVMKRSSKKCENAFVLAKGRPAAGTLVVCPTSVLRQWADELHNKVNKEANLSVLVYHGSNRTRDPFELAKYDVVLTTYSIVSMEVPKQPLVDKDEEKGMSEADGPSSMGISSGRKRKYPPSSNKKGRKDKNGMNDALLESAARPLARVGWFRVVLDEAQSIKNHRTQVARACWGLRAKRRWCLSGTPIQNAVDDLYSYFRFLRYDPYAVYKSFLSTIKVPIHRNPTNGYKKLQAVLKTIMLRRTKGTLLDGEPIINLPPKTIELKKVDFSEEERDFYSQLEADSRAQFKVYAAAGTVKQNYVNILLMLLRLRQACDHPYLVKGYDSSSVWRSSVEIAKKLPRETQMGLLNCLEACLAICGICNDPPEDAVVTICGHVFCNQCICEHLSGDETLCPSAQCKVHLSVTSVFSRPTLKRSLSEQSEQVGHDCSVDKSGFQLVETVEPCSEGFSDSSKIKAALEVLQAISKPGHCTLKSSSESTDEVAILPGDNSDSGSVASCKDLTEKKLVDMEKTPNDSITKVSEKAIVFSQWTRMLDLLEARLKSSSIQYRRLDGTMSVVARDKAVKDFNTLPEVSVMIMSLKAASLGLNMVAACHVLLLDLWWNPTTEDQAIDRAHRIGQTRPVTVLRLTVKDTVEDRILALQEKKREMVASAFGEDETGSRQTRLTVDDLKYLFMA